MDGALLSRSVSEDWADGDWFSGLETSRWEACRFGWTLLGGTKACAGEIREVAASKTDLQMIAMVRERL